MTGIGRPVNPTTFFPCVMLFAALLTASPISLSASELLFAYSARIRSRCSGNPAALLNTLYSWFSRRRRMLAAWASSVSPAASKAVFRRFSFRAVRSI